MIVDVVSRLISAMPWRYRVAVAVRNAIARTLPSQSHIEIGVLLTTFRPLSFHYDIDIAIDIE